MIFIKKHFLNKLIKFSWTIPIFIILLISISSLISQSNKILKLQNPVIYYNGAIFTLEKDKTGKEIIQQAMRTENGKITHIGTNEKVLKLKNSQTSLVDLNGKSVFPSFVGIKIKQDEKLTEVFKQIQEIKKQGFLTNSNERLNLFLEAFRNLTIKTAIQNNTEKEEGTLSPGKIANFIILDKNPLLFNPAKYNEINVFLTIFEGRNPQLNN